MEFHVISDGWIKVPTADFYVGGARPRSERLLIGLNQLLVRIADRIVLIDAGLGDETRAGLTGLLDFERPRRLPAELRRLGVSPEAVSDVIFTHLHYDHCGGGVTHSGGSDLASTFPNAVYYVQRRELEFAQHPDPECAEDYRRDDFQPLIDDARLRILDGQSEILSGIRAVPTPGHSPGHQSVLIEDHGRVVFFPGDLFSTREHANLEITSVYDRDPAATVGERKEWLRRAVDGGWDCVFCHAIRNPIGRLNAEARVV